MLARASRAVFAGLQPRGGLLHTDRLHTHLLCGGLPHAKLLCGGLLRGGLPRARLLRAKLLLRGVEQLSVELRSAELRSAEPRWGRGASAAVTTVAAAALAPR